MADIPKEELKKEIEEVLKTVDLNKTGIKHVIQQLEKRLGTDLSGQKKEIDRMVMDYVNSMDTDESEEEEEEEEVVKKKESSDDDIEEKDDKKDGDWGSKKKKRGEDKKKKADDKKKKTPKAKKGGVTKKGKGSAFTRPYKLTPALAELMGAQELPRYEVVKRMSAIIKERQLLDPSNRQFTICDKELYNIFGTQRFHTFGMMKYLKHHFLKDE